MIGGSQREQNPPSLPVSCTRRYFDPNPYLRREHAHPSTHGLLAQVSFRGDGPLQGVQAIAEATGQVKGSVGNPRADPPLQHSGKLNVGAAVGEGDLQFSSQSLRRSDCVSVSISTPPPWVACVTHIPGSVKQALLQINLARCSVHGLVIAGAPGGGGCLRPPSKPWIQWQQIREDRSSSV